MEEGRRARLALGVLVACEAVAVAGLHRLGSVDGFAIPRRDLGRWLTETRSEDVLLVGIRLVALVAAWWLLATTLLYLAVRIARLHGAERAVGWATVPAVRRWADRAAAVSIVAASALGAARPAGAGPPPTIPAPPPVVVDLDHRSRATRPDQPQASVRTGRAGDAASSPTAPAPETPPAPAVPVVPGGPAPPASATPPPPRRASGATHVITRGEHLWSIAADRVAAATGRAGADPTPADVAPYWRRLVDLNRSRLRSGDVNLVYPGETIELPPP